MTKPVPQDMQDVINEVSSTASGRGDLTNQYKVLDTIIEDSLKGVAYNIENSAYNTVIKDNGQVDIVNSTNIPLSANAVFNGLSVDSLNYAMILVSVYSNVASATKGFCLQFSTDNINWFDAECYTIGDGETKSFSYQPEAKYYKVKYTNGAIAQGAFRLQITLKKMYIKPSSHAIDDIIGDNDDAELTKSVLTGKDVSSSNFVNVGTKVGQVGNNLLVSVDQVEGTTNSLKTISYSHAELHSGDHYFSRGNELLVRNNVKNILIVTPDTPRLAHMVVAVEGLTSTILVQIYESTVTSNNGTRDNERNRNRNYSDNNTTFIYYSPTITTVGNLLAEAKYGAGRNSAGGGVRDVEEILLKRNTKYLVRITEQNISDTQINWGFDWYEHTNLG